MSIIAIILALISLVFSVRLLLINRKLQKEADDLRKEQRYLIQELRDDRELRAEVELEFVKLQMEVHDSRLAEEDYRHQLSAAWRSLQLVLGDTEPVDPVNYEYYWRRLNPQPSNNN